MTDGSRHPERARPQKSKPAASTSPAQQIESDATQTNDRDGRFLLFQAMPSWLASFLVNVSFILVLALFAIPLEKENIISLEAGEIDSASVEDINLDLDDMELSESDPLESELTEPIVEVNPETEELTIDTDILSDDSNILAGEESNFEGGEFSELDPTEMTSEISGRTGSGKDQALRKNGGNAASEEAVQLALQWIADHQLPNGSWSLDHSIGPKINERPRTSPNPGQREDAQLGATALALLPFLANGQTHKNGEFKDVVLQGLRFLMNNAQRPTQDAGLPRFANAKGLSYRDLGGHMYSHALCTIFMCECYSMSGDERLREFAQGALDFIDSTQRTGRGGWEYQTSSQSGKVVDTSVLGWQIMAIKSGKLAGLDVNQRTYKLSSLFLKGISIDNGAVYGYSFPAEKTPKGNYYKIDRSVTSVGLLCRMYMGWQRDKMGLMKGVKWLNELGPDTSGSISAAGEVLENQRAISPYYNYHATQVMIHYGGDDWKRWNDGYTDNRGKKVIGMRDFLVASQEKEGPSKGSWMFNPNGKWEAVGGRLYSTALSCLTLEVYYRYLPMFSDNAIDDDFSTDF